MKKLHEFEVKKKQLVKESETSTDASGATVTITKEVEKDVPVKFFIRKPNRAMGDEAELFYAIQLSEGIKKGLLTRAQLATKFNDEASPLTTAERKRYNECLEKFVGKEAEYREVNLVPEAERSPEQKEKAEKLMKELLELTSEINYLEGRQNSLFNHTAEVYARNRTIIWWALHLGYNADETPIFGNGKFEERLTKANEFDEKDDEFMMKVYNHLIFLLSFWYTGRAEKPEDFEHLEKMAGIKG